MTTASQVFKTFSAARNFFESKAQTESEYFDSEAKTYDAINSGEIIISWPRDKSKEKLNAFESGGSLIVDFTSESGETTRFSTRKGGGYIRIDGEQIFGSGGSAYSCTYNDPKDFLKWVKTHITKKQNLYTEMFR